MLARIVAVVVALAAVFILFLYLLGTGAWVDTPTAESPQASLRAPDVVRARAAAQRRGAQTVGVVRPKQILFGDLHVHSTFSFDAFQLSLPLTGGQGAHPVSEACDFARHCSALDFWSINDHAITLGTRRWQETVRAIRECNALAGDEPDTVAYLGWEWTQVGSKPGNHYGHKNVVVRDLEDGAIPARPIAAGLATDDGTLDIQDTGVGPLVLGALAVAEYGQGGPELAEYFYETTSFEPCPSGVPVRDLPPDCQEFAPTPEDLWAKLDDWGLATMVIPHGTTWGFYTPLGSSWDKQLAPGMHDAERQRLIEVFSGHGNSEEYRPFREVEIAADGSRSCPAPNHGFLPGCWRAGEIIEERCLDEGLPADECSRRTAEARQHFVDTDRNGGAATVPGWEVADWLDAGQCRDCFQPSFNYRPRSSAQYILALDRDNGPEAPDRFRFGFIASSDNHSARPGTGYKEVSRREFTEARFRDFTKTPIGEGRNLEKASRSEAIDPDSFGPQIFALFETERGASFFLNGGLAAVHSEGRSREEIWDAMQRREVYGTSGPRILLWFDLLNGPEGRPVPMGSAAALREPPIFQVRAVGSFEQKPGCPSDAVDAMGDERIARLCQGECYHPSDERRRITRIEVVRIRPQQRDDEAVAPLVEDPWKVIDCQPDPAGCSAAFTDPDFHRSGRDAVYYVRAVEAPSLAVGADPLGCRRDDQGRCVEVRPCASRDLDDDCLAPTEERAWSSPIFVDQPRA